MGQASHVSVPRLSLCHGILGEGQARGVDMGVSATGLWAGLSLEAPLGLASGLHGVPYLQEWIGGKVGRWP